MAATEITFHFRKGDEPQGGVTFQKLITPGKMACFRSRHVRSHYRPGGLITFHRPDFQRVLLGRLPRHCRTHTSKRLVSYKQDLSSSQPIQLYFQDGTTATCDFLVGADGVKSAVRASMLEDVAAGLRARGQADDADVVLRAVKPVWSGTMAYRTAIRTEDVQRRFPNHRVLTQPHVVRPSGASRTLSGRAHLT